MTLTSQFNNAALWGREILSFALPMGMAWRGPSKLEPKAQIDVPRRPVTKAELNTTPRFYNNGKNALIWAYIGGDTPTRGDTHGTMGLARRVSEIIDGRVVVVDRKMLEENFENLPRVTQLLELVKRDGYPDMIMGAHSTQIPSSISSKATLRLTQVNEDLSGSFLSTAGDLVAHHLTPSMLAAEGEKFDQHYPDAKKGTLTAIMCANFYAGKTELARKTAKIMAHEKQGTIFVCPSHRTLENDRLKFTSRLKGRIEALGAGDRIHVESLPFAAIEQGAYNPYRGLLALADHIMVVGHSQSMVSEALFTGKRVHTASPYTHEYFWPRRRGHVKDFNRCSERKPLSSPSLTPYDITGDTADKIVRAFDRLSRLRTLANKDAPAL